MEVCFLASGEKVAVLDAAEFEGKTAKAVKQALATNIGVTRFKQRLFLEGNASEIPDDEIFSSVPPKLQLVVLEFCPPHVALDEQIIMAARGNDTVGLEHLLNCPRSPNTRDALGKTPLYHAADRGHVEPMRLLLEAGADIDAPSGEVAPLHIAAFRGHLEAVRFLVQNGAQKDLADAGGSTPLTLALYGGDVAIARFLVEEGASTSEIVAHWKLLIDAAGSGDADMVHFLLQIGCDKDKANDWGETPLHAAAAEGHLHIVRFLVESGASRHATTTGTYGPAATALDLASESGHAEVVRFLSELEAESP
eukprot:s837_g9.t1